MAKFVKYNLPFSNFKK